jgi:hypothetical protein
MKKQLLKSIKGNEDCDECGRSYPRDAMQLAIRTYYKEVWVCDECIKNFHYCNAINRYVDSRLVDANGECLYCYGKDKGGEK